MNHNSFVKINEGNLYGISQLHNFIHCLLSRGEEETMLTWPNERKDTSLLACDAGHVADNPRAFVFCRTLRNRKRSSNR